VEEVAQKLISSDYADHAATQVRQFFAQLVPTELLLPQAMQLSRSLDHSVYDCCYLALAMRENAPLITADRRLIEVARRLPQAAEVILLSEGNWAK
jgi:predicted nucleic acid-binding protein